MERTTKRREPRKNTLSPIIPIAIAGLALLSACTNWSPIARHDVVDGRPCEIDWTSSSGYFGALQYLDSHSALVESFNLKGNDLVMRARIYGMLHIVIARYGGTIEGMQGDLEKLYPDCHVLVTKIVNNGNNISQPNADISAIIDSLTRFVNTDENEFPDAIKIVIPNFQTSQGQQVEEQRQKFIVEAKRKFNGDMHILVGRDISKDVVYNAQGQFDESYLIMKNGKGVHLQPVKQAEWFMIITNPDTNTFK